MQIPLAEKGVFPEKNKIKVGKSLKEFPSDTVKAGTCICVHGSSDMANSCSYGLKALAI